MIRSHGFKESSAIQGGTALALTLRIAAAYLPTCEKVRLLDIGCGAGAFLRALPSSFDATGVDYNGRAPFSVNISYEKLPFPDASFDLVTAWQVFEHLENPFFAGREIERVLKKGGLCVISVPNIRRALSRWHFFKTGNLLRWSNTNDHIFVPLKSVLKKAVFPHCRMFWLGYGEHSRSFFFSLIAKNIYYVFQKS